MRKALDGLLAANGINVAVGILSGRPKYPDGQAVATVAAVQEARENWMRRTVDSRGAKFAAEAGEFLVAILRGESPTDKAAELGDSLAVDMKRQIETQGLLETGRLRDTIASEVKVKAGGKQL